MIDTYSETTREPWSVVWRTDVNEFFAVIQYAIYKNKRKEEALRKYKNGRI